MHTSAIRIWLLGLALASAVVVVPHPVAAAPRASAASVQRARRHFLSGKRAFEAKRYATALKEFGAGYAIEPRPGFLLNMGHAARRMGELRRARELYLKFIAADPTADERRATLDLIAEIDRELGPPAPAASHRAEAPEPTAPVAPAPSAPAVETVPDAPPPEPPVAVTANTAAPTPTRAPAPVEEERPRVKVPAAALSLAETPTRLVAERSGDAPSSSSSPSSAPAPVYRRWWFWAGAGVAAGLVTAVLIGTLGSGSAARDSGTWGQIRL
jgi:hypothetical protein